MSALAAAQAEVAQLRALLAAKDDALAAQQEQLARNYQALRAKESELEQLRAQIAWLRKQVFGAGKSEQLDRRQLELALQGLEARLAEAEQAAASEPAPKTKSPQRPTRPSRQERYGNLPIEETVTIEPEEVQAEPEAFERIGEEMTFEVVVEPPRFFRRQIVRPRYRRKGHRDAPPVLAPAPRRVVEGIASIELLVHVVLSKYADHLPLYRQGRMYEREGVQIPTQNLMRWVEVVADWLKPIYAHMGSELKAGDYIQADETPIKYLDRDIKKGKAQQGQLVGFSRPGGNVVFTWHTSRSKEAITEFLPGFAGHLQTDGYAVWSSYARDHDEIIAVSCLAHIRREFHRALEHSPRRAALVLRLIGELYGIERTARQKGFSPKLTAVLRQSQARPLYHRLQKIFAILHEKELPSSPLRKACQYALGQWPALASYLDHGHLHIDNNAMERAIRPSAIGKKNYLFVGHPKAGDRPAILYSLLVSCERFGHNPREYLTDVLRRLCQEPDRLHPRAPHALTPAGWKPPGQ
jgi:transposase